MTQEELDKLDSILFAPNEAFKARTRLIEWRKTLQAEEAPETPAESTTAPHSARTDSQHRSLFLWFGMIEKEAENQGVTWDRIVKHTHQLRVTKENLHEACKQLTKALWGINSTKQLAKQGHLDIIIDHFVDLFAKEGLTLPPFPSDETKNNIMLTAMENLHDEEYPEYTGAPTL